MSSENTTYAGIILPVTIIVLACAASCACVAVGIFFGAGYGFACASAAFLLTGVGLASTLRRMPHHKETDRQP